MPKANHVIKFDLTDREHEDLRAVFSSSKRVTDVLSVMRQDPKERKDFLVYGSLPECAEPFIGMMVMQSGTHELLGVSGMGRKLSDPLVVNVRGIVYELMLTHNGEKITDAVLWDSRTKEVM